MFKAIVCMDEVATGGSFAEVFMPWKKKIQELIGAGQMSMQALETACWIEGPTDEAMLSFVRKQMKRLEGGVKLMKGGAWFVAEFYDARDFAYEIGIGATE